MSRKIHALIVKDNLAAVILETASSGDRWGKPVRLSTVRLQTQDMVCLLEQRVLGNAKVEQIESWHVDGSSRGDRSKFGRTLKAMKEELAGHVGGDAANVLITEQELSAEVVQGLFELARSMGTERRLDATLPQAGSSTELRMRF